MASTLSQDTKHRRSSATSFNVQTNAPVTSRPFPHSHVDFEWVDDTRTSSASGGRRVVRRFARGHDVVRRHAATVSAAARLATIRKRSAFSPQASHVVSSQFQPRNDQPWYVLRLLDEQPWYREAVRFNSVCQKSTRALLWTSLNSHAALWQSAFLILATYSNNHEPQTSMLHRVGSWLIYHRGEALKAISASLASGSKAHMTCMAIALLAAWERRFGDAETSDVHMNAWKRSRFPPSPLEESNVDALMDAVCVATTEHLFERSNEVHKVGTKKLYHSPEHLPPGFRLFSRNQPETRSLLHLVGEYAISDPEATNGVALSRALRIENMAWSPSHTLSHNPRIMLCVAYEESWDRHELWALYHIRAALVSLTGHLGMVSDSDQSADWIENIALGLEIYTDECRHLRTEDLMGGDYQEIALWAQFTMCSISRVASRDAQLRIWIRYCGIDDWPQMQCLLERHSPSEPLIGNKTEILYRTLMEN